MFCEQLCGAFGVVGRHQHAHTTERGLQRQRGAGQHVAFEPRRDLVLIEQRLSIQQAKTLEVGTVTLHGTGEPLLDERTFDAVFSGRRVVAQVDGPLSDTCPQRYSLFFRYDFDGVAPRVLTLSFQRLNTCSGNAGATCEGSVRSDLGEAQPVNAL